LKQPVFCHGKLYVAFSRVSKFECVKIYAENFEGRKGELLPEQYFPPNIVYSELIDDFD